MTPVTATTWRTAASCARPDVDPQMFFAGAGTPDQLEALDHCQRCTVTRQCLTAALDRDEKYGTWGGVTAGTPQWNELAKEPR